MDRMNARKFHLLIVVAVAVSMSGAMVASALQNLPAKDLLGGAGLLFKPPQNPAIQRRKNQPSPSPEASKTEKPLARPQNNDNVSDKVEDAIELENAAAIAGRRISPPPKRPIAWRGNSIPAMLVPMWVWETSTSTNSDIRKPRRHTETRSNCRSQPAWVSRLWRDVNADGHAQYRRPRFGSNRAGACLSGCGNAPSGRFDWS